MRTADPHRIVFLGAGISRYPNGGDKLADLQAGSIDVQQCFEAFVRCSGDQLDVGSSLVTTNISAPQFVAALEVALERVSNKRDLLIVYFSGHATFEENELILQFSDAPSKSGLLSITRFMDLHRTYRWPPVLLILDCCYAGGARTTLGWSSKGPHIHSNISLLASSGPFQRSTDGAYLSPFTEAVVKASGELLNENRKISVHGLIDRVQSHLDSSQKAEVLIPDGKHDVTISGKDLARESFDKLATDLLERVRNGAEFNREAMWFSLSDETEVLALTVSERCLSEGLSEASWLVRRAIGSTLGDVKYLEGRREKHLQKMLSSGDWMNTIVALNALKRSAKSAIKFVEYATSSNEPMDVKWLGLLYASDMCPASSWSPEAFKRCHFLESSWGTAEVIDRLYRPHAQASPEVDRLLGMCSTQTRLSVEWLRALRDGHSADPKYEGRRIPTKLLQCARSILNQGSRGSTGASGTRKWLRSKLYGNWRGAVTIDLNRSLGMLTTKERREFIEQVPVLLPTVNAKMAVLDAFTPEACPDLSCLRWGIMDPHPWVRRSFLACLRRLSDKDANKLAESVDWLDDALTADRAAFPGTLDLLFEGHKALLGLRNQDGLQHAAKVAWERLAHYEAIALRRALRNENIFVVW